MGSTKKRKQRGTAARGKPRDIGRYFRAAEVKAPSPETRQTRGKPKRSPKSRETSTADSAEFSQAGMTQQGAASQGSIEPERKGQQHVHRAGRKESPTGSGSPGAGDPREQEKVNLRSGGERTHTKAGKGEKKETLSASKNKPGTRGTASQGGEQKKDKLGREGVNLLPIPQIKKHQRNLG